MHTVSALRGMEWILTGWRLFRRGPTNWLFAVISYWLVMALAGLIPWLGPLLATLFVPAFGVSFMVISRDLDQRRPMDPALIFSGFRVRLPVLVHLGGIYLAATLTILMLSQFADGGLLLKWILFNEVPKHPDPSQSGIGNAALLIAFLYVPVLLAFWFAPVLVAWHGMGALQALFYSFFACLRNWRAFLAYGTTWLFIGAVLPSTVGTMLAIVLSGGAPNPTISQVLLLVFLLLAVPTLLGSFYASYRDLFAPSGPPSPPAAPAPPADAGTPDQ